MRTPTVLAAMVAAALFTLATPKSHAATIVQTLPFEFPLLPFIEDVIYGYDVQYAGTDQLSFNPFDTSFGQLTKVKLELVMIIEGNLYIETYESTDVVTDSYLDGVELYFEGQASSGNLLAEADFGPYVVGVDGVLTPEGLYINEYGEGMDMTTDPLDFPDFTDPPLTQVLVDLEACVMVEYLNQEIGGSEDLTAFGDVTLTYIYTIDGEIIPTPAALPGGLALLAISALRRRRG